MEFYTDPRGIECDYALVKIQDYLKHKDKLHHKKILIDPGVYDLTPDYPFDVQPQLTQQECIDKTWENILKWKDHENVIIPVQYAFENFIDFKQNYKKAYSFQNDYIGIGNLCKSRKLTFLKQVINYIILNNPEKKKIHFFGLYKKAIKYLILSKPIFEITIDSMKWDYGLFYQRKPGEENNTRAYRWGDFKKYLRDIEKWEGQAKTQTIIPSFLKI